MPSNEESYVTKDEQIPVQEDSDAVEEGVDEATADSDAQLGMSASVPLQHAWHLC